MGINQISVFQISMSSRNSYVEILPKPQADPWTTWVWVVRAHLYVDFFFSTNMCAVLQHDTISACFNPKCRTTDTESWLGSYTRIVQGSVPLILEFCSSRVNLIRRWASESAWRRKWQRTPVFLLENSMDGGAWQAAVHGVAKSWTRLSDWAHTHLGVSRSRGLRLCEWDCGGGGSVTESCWALCNPVDCSTPGFPVLHYLPEFTHTQVYWVSDAIHLT